MQCNLTNERELRPEELWRPGKGRDISKFKPKHLTLKNVGQHSLFDTLKNSLEQLNEKDITKDVKNQNVKVCGVEGPPVKVGSKEPLIIGGDSAEAGQFPWAAALFIDGAWFCGGTLISAGHVLTAAHCVDGAWYVDVQLGSVDVGGSEDSIMVTSFNFEIHPDWNPMTLSNDIAIITLPDELEFTDYISPICLPTAEDKVDPGDLVTIIGWGKQSDTGSVSSSLQFVQVPVLSEDVCEGVYGDLGPGVGCVQGPSTCNGDSGGSIMSPVETKDGDQGKIWRQSGIVSFGSSLGCEIETPNGFTKIENYLDWISQEMGKQ